MLKTIIKASQNFCTHQIRLKSTIVDGVCKKRTLIAYIDIQTQDEKLYRVYIAPDMNFAQRVSMLFLEEDESDEETLVDMTLELTNLIVGSAKVIAQEEDNLQYIIKTPHFVTVDSFELDVDNGHIIQVEDDEMIVAIKEL